MTEEILLLNYPKEFKHTTWYCLVKGPEENPDIRDYILSLKQPATDINI
jgi:hypothetical protein